MSKAIKKKKRIPKFYNGVKDSVLWNLYHPMGEYIVKHLKAFKEMPRMGYPCVSITEKSRDNTLTEFNDGEAERWENTLEAMIDGWETLVNWDDISMDIYDKYNSGGVVLEMNRKAWLKENNLKYKVAQKNAMLFVKHIHSLWD